MNNKDKSKLEKEKSNFNKDNSSKSVVKKDETSIIKKDKRQTKKTQHIESITGPKRVKVISKYPAVIPHSVMRRGKLRTLNYKLEPGKTYDLPSEIVNKIQNGSYKNIVKIVLS